METPDDFPKLPNRLEMIGDLKATFLLNRLLDPKSDLFKLVVIPKVEEVMTQIVDRDEKWQSPYPYKFSVSRVVFIVNVEQKRNQEVSPS